MIKIVRLAAAMSIVLAVTAPALAQDASRAVPGTAPANGVDGAGGKAATQGEREGQAKSGTEGNDDAPASGQGGCPYIKRKLELIV